MTAKEKIINAAITAFRVKGIKNVTMDNISQSAGVSKRTVYELFSDKDTLALEAIKEMILQNNKEIITILGQTENVIEALFWIMENESTRRQDLSPLLQEDIARYQHEIILQMQNNHKQKCEFSALCAFLLKGIEQGIFKDDLNIDIIDNFLHESIGLLHISPRLKQYQFSHNDIIMNVFIPYIRGLCTDKGLKLMNKYFEKKIKEN